MSRHVSIFNGVWDGFVTVPTYIWIFDRILRILRVTAFKPLAWGSEAQVTYSTEADIVQLSLPVEWYSLRRPNPGTFYYLTVLSDLKSRWQSHPFTVACVVTDNGDMESVGERTALLAHTLRSDATKQEVPKSSTSMDFLIRPYNGFTAELRDLAETSKSVKVLVDGPYGTSHPLRTYSHVLFIAGGTGIVTPISYLSSLVHKSSSTPSVILHWSVREPAFANMVLEQYLDVALGAQNFTTTLHSSQRFNLRSEFSGAVCQEMGRPDIPAIIEAAAAQAHLGRLAVVACGPEGMLDDARLGVIRTLKHARCTVDYFQDSFAW